MLLSLADAELAHGELPLLDRAAFAMEAGERIGLIGRNGTGKSSLLGIIAGTGALDEGELKKRDGLRVVLVEQEPQLPHASHLRESLLLRGHIPQIADERERWRVEARLTEFLHRFGVDEDLAPDAASGGETKRAALALAFALAPELLLLDEPTGGIDPEAQEQFYELLQTLNRSHAVTLILVTHDIAVVGSAVRKLACLNRRLVFHGEPKEFLSDAALSSLYGAPVHLLSHRH